MVLLPMKIQSCTELALGSLLYPFSPLFIAISTNANVTGPNRRFKTTARDFGDINFKVYLFEVFGNFNTGTSTAELYEVVLNPLPGGNSTCKRS